jgi:hypothetical protein
VTLASSPTTGLFLCTSAVYTNVCGASPTTITTLGGGVTINGSSVVTLSSGGAFRIVCGAPTGSSFNSSFFSISSSSGTVYTAVNGGVNATFGSGYALFYVYSALAGATITFSSTSPGYAAGTWQIEVTQL